MLVVHRAASLDCAGPRGTKSRVAAEICALLAFAAVRSHDRVGLLCFTDRIESYVPPGKGPRHAQRLIADVLRQSPSGRGTDLAGALRYLQRVLHRGSILFLISDFIAPEFRLPLAAAARRHDVVAVSVTDPTDDELPAEGFCASSMWKPESGASWTPMTSASARPTGNTPPRRGRSSPRH